MKRKIYLVDQNSHDEVFAYTIPGFVRMLNRELKSRNSDKRVAKFSPKKQINFCFPWKFFTTKGEANDFLIKK